MKKYIKNISAPIIATSLATIGFASYKMLKKKYPQKVDNVNENIKNTLNNLKIKNKSKNISNDNNDFYKNQPNDFMPNNINTQNNTNQNINIQNNVNKNEYLTQNDILSNNKNLQNNKNLDNLNNNIDTQQSITFTAINVDNNITFTNATTFEQEEIQLDKSFINEQTPKDTKPDIKSDEPLVKSINNESIQHLEPEELKEIDDFFKSIAEEEIKQHQKEEEIENLQDTFNEILLPDNYIEDEIRYQLCLSNKEPITKETLKKLERIDFFEIDDYDIDMYCDFLAKYTNIKSIVIDALNPTKYNTMVEQNEQKHCLKNISPLTSLKSLQELSFNWGIENIDFSCISSLTSLKKLEIKFGMLKNIDFISNLKNLEHLEIMISNNVTDLSPLLTLSNLKNLYIYTNIKLDISPLKNIKSLQNIYINGECITMF